MAKKKNAGKKFEFSKLNEFLSSDVNPIGSLINENEFIDTKEFISSGIYALDALLSTKILKGGIPNNKVVAIGEPIKGATEGWYVPRYVIEGDSKRNLPAKAPNLSKIADLAAYSAVFKDQEEPSKGRFYNCPAGWTCELENTKKLARHNLNESLVNFHPGTGAALDAAIASSYKRREPILTYYWSPTAMLGKFDMVKLEEAPGDEHPIKIQIGVSKVFHDMDPTLMQVFSKVNIPIDLLNKNLATMADERISADKLAIRFLQENPLVWQQWVNSETAAKIQASLP